MHAPVRGWRRAMILLTVAAMTLLMAAVASTPASAAPAPSATPSAPTSTPSVPSTASSAKQAEANYTPAACNSAGKSAGAGKSVGAEKSTPSTELARCFAMVSTPQDQQITANADAPPATALGPEQIQDAYSLPATGQGQTVAIVDAYGDSLAEEDLAQFRSYYGLPSCTSANGCFTKVDQNGGTDYPADDSGWGLETSLDIDAVSAACPNCDILLVQADDASVANLSQAVDIAVSLGAKYVSNSYGLSGEDQSELQFDAYFDHPGVAITASTGDTGNVTNWPAANPDVVAVGGTTLTQDSGNARGWSEAAWVDAGSGCSPYEPQPDYQSGIDTQCDNRAMADISAVADPSSGLAVFDSLGYEGWLQVGGTSLSSPLVASMYALAGTPAPGTYPVTYPYQAPSSDLFDVTAGSNGSCGNVQCTAGPKWDGPTGLGTPNGVAALTTGPQGDIVGKVTNSATGKALAGATVSTPNGYSATTDANGTYKMPVSVGSYDTTAAAFGYNSKAATGAQVTENHDTTVNFSLTAIPTHKLSGTVTDGSGQGWPLYAKITIDGYPNVAVYTDPNTGRYSVDLPQGFTANLHVAPVIPGYLTTEQSVAITTDKVLNVKALVDGSTCLTPGYAYSYAGTGTQFTGWTGNSTQDGWTNVDNNGSGDVWQFDNPGGEPVPPGGDDSFAILDSDNYGRWDTTISEDASLVSPVTDLSGQTAPAIDFDTYYNVYFASTADVDLSLDGGQTWSTVWHQDTTSVSGHVNVPIPQAAGQSDVQVRFRYTGRFEWWWAIDNVSIGKATCVAQSGGLVTGVVHDDNTGSPLNNAKVTNANGEFGVSAATPDDAKLSDGYYWLYSSVTGARKFTVTDSRYTTATGTVKVAANSVTHKDWTLRAGHLSITPSNLSVTEKPGETKSGTVTLTNDGTEPVHVQLSEQDSDFTPPAGQPATAAPTTLIEGDFSPAAAALTPSPDATATGGTSAQTPAVSGSAWTNIGDYPTPIMDNAVGYEDGLVYSVGGYDGKETVATGYVYDPTAGTWSQIAGLPEALESPGGTFLDGKMYVVGGWDAAGRTSNRVYAYDPGPNTWTQVADLPTWVSAPAVTTLGGELYVVGGCRDGFCSPGSQSAFRYDPDRDSWTALADYPVPTAFAACAGTAGELVCAGGTSDYPTGLKATYLYDPGTDTWTQAADMPYDDWGMTYSAAGNRLQIAGGVINNGRATTNQAVEFDPSDNTWTALPNDNLAEYRGGGSCGMYKVGGSTGGLTAQPVGEVLAGYSSCGVTDAAWLSENKTGFDLAPGKSVKVTVTMNASLVAQPGSYTAEVGISTDAPYSFAPVGVSMQVNRPASWGKISGTVTSAADGSPLAGATVKVTTRKGAGVTTYTLTTDAGGHYQLWLNAADTPLQVSVSKDGYQPKAKSVKITKGATTTANFALTKV